MKISCRFGWHDWIHEKEQINKWADTGQLVIRNFWRCKCCGKLKVK